MEAAERRNLRCVWVSGGRALTEHEAAVEVVSQARLLLQEDLALLGIRWDPATLPPEAPDHPDNHRNHVNATSASPHEEQIISIKDEQERNMGKTRDCDGTDDCEKENKEDYKHENNTTMGESKREHRNSKPGENRANTRLDEHGINDRTEPVARHSTDGHKEMEDIETNNEEDANLQIEGQNQEMDQRKGMSSRSEAHPAKHPVDERSLTQELAEIMFSPLPELISRPQLSLSPVTPCRLRTPVSRVEARQPFPPNVSERHRTTSLVSPVHPGRLEHARVLNKVLHSIQTDKSLQGYVQVAPPEASLAQDPAPEGQPSKAQAPFPEAAVRAPTNANIQASLSLSPVSATVQPEAKRRRTDFTGVDSFSSPELYAGYEDTADKDGESFGDSFELDTQTEKMIVQRASPHGDGGGLGTDRSGETEKTRKKKIVQTEEKQGTVTNNGLQTDSGCSRLSISITESQMEFILNSSHEVSDLN